MKAIVRIFSCAGALCLLAGAAAADDGVLVVQKLTSGTGAATTHQIQIEPHRMRSESSGARGESMVMVFDGTRQVMLTINDTAKTYTEITRADLDAAGSMMSQMEAQLKNMPPQQRAQIEALMKGRGAAAAPAKIQYKKTGTDTVGKWTCDKYEGSRDGHKVQELCTVDPKVLGFGAADFAVTKELAAFFQSVMPAQAMQTFHIGTVEEQGFSGVPVRTTTFVGAQTMTQEITDVRRQSFSDATFQVPAGYEKKPSPFAGRGRGRQ
jgi:hypothetical protein